MGHAVHALITTRPIAGRATAELPPARAFALPRGLAIVPLTTAVLESLEGAAPTVDEALANFAARLSSDGMVVEIETDYFGGVGEQRAVAWRGGVVVLSAPWSSAIETAPINSGLRLLGVEASGSDEFDAIGLGAVRHTDDWLRKGDPIL